MSNAEVRLGSYADVLNDVRADLIFTSPPYNIGSEQVKIIGGRNGGGYDSKSYSAITEYPDDMPEGEYQDSQAEFFLWAGDHLAKNGILVYNHKPRRVNGEMIHPAIWFLRQEVRQTLTLMEEIIWDRGSTHNHSDRLMWPHTERLYVFRRTTDKYLFQNHRGLPYRSDVWSIGIDRRGAIDVGHNAPFPMSIATGVLSAWSRVGDLVCDPYTGSGTTGIAALTLNRRFVGAELMPKYHSLAVDRIAATERDLIGQIPFSDPLPPDLGVQAPIF